jgi:type I restriction-modification system DNA methylase subunit
MRAAMNPAPLPSTREAAGSEVERLVKKFKALPVTRRRLYNEADTRKDFILPLFRALQWDTEDASQVTAEEKISRGFVDFSFRINGIRRFVLETKSIHEGLDDVKHAQQARDYAYHKGVTWAVLSDFAALKILNAELREPNPFQATFKAFEVDDYLTRFDELWWLSRPAFEEGILDREAENVFKRSIRVPITQSLFDSLKEWRRELYKNLRAYNEGKLYTPKMIDDAVQRILDRLIFIRTAEDRDVEDEKLRALVRELQDRNRLNDLSTGLNRRFRELDRVYNSQLFAPHPSEDLDGGEPSTLVKIVEGMYGSPANYVSYNFALIDADVLGRVYEQYLGYVLSERDEIEAKKAKRKSQGIYYTPTFVVKYIVQQTLGRYLQEYGYNPSHPVRVLDLACGSGSFLIEAFDVLDQYLAREKNQEQGAYDIHDHARQLQVLTQNIYGVDKDEQAVEVARLNLMLKALHLRDRLPKLEHIQQGDSLISGAPKELEEYFGAKWKEKNPFDWDKMFPEVIKEGGFDVIVGNPPYVRIQTLPKDEVLYYNDRYKAATGNYDIYVLFVEQALQLLKPGGVMGFILPRKFFNTDYGTGLRRLITDAKALWKIVDFGDAQVFLGSHNLHLSPVPG